MRIKIIGLIVIAAAAGIIFFWFLRGGSSGQAGQRSAPVNVAEAPAPAPATPAAAFSVPSGDQIFKVVQAAGIYPKFVQVEINPPDVHVGDTQTLGVVIEDPNPIVSVTAETQLDHGKVTINLSPANSASGWKILPTDYAVDPRGALTILAKPISPIALGGVAVANADTNGLPSGGATTSGYEATWTVRDTHNTYYHTTFIAKDSAGHSSSITLAWSDLCGLPNGGNATISSPCTIGGTTDGVDNGNLTVANSITLSSASVLVFNPGFSITISSGGSIIISNSSVQKTYLWALDADGDGYASGSSWAASASSPGNGYVRRYTFAGSLGDCNDNNANVNPGQTAYFTTATTTDLGPNTFDYNCDGNISKNPAIYAANDGSGGICPATSCTAGNFNTSTAPIACGTDALSIPNAYNDVSACSLNPPDCIETHDSFTVACR